MPAFGPVVVPKGGGACHEGSVSVPGGTVAILIFRRKIAVFPSILPSEKKQRRLDTVVRGQGLLVPCARRARTHQTSEACVESCFGMPSL